MAHPHEQDEDGETSAEQGLRALVRVLARSAARDLIAASPACPHDEEVPHGDRQDTP